MWLVSDEKIQDVAWTLSNDLYCARFGGKTEGICSTPGLGSLRMVGEASA